MTNYTTIDQMVNSDQIETNDRLQFIRKWLADQYEIKSSNPQWLDLFSDVHDHDNLPKHFGQVKIGSTFAAAVTQLVRLPDGWHIAISNKNNEMVPIHPKREGSYTHPSNQKLLLQLRQVVKGKVSQQPQLAAGGTGVQSLSPAGALTAEDLYQAEDREIAEKDNLGPAVTSTTPFTQQKTQSVDIDISRFL
jgi:hypothetical protein